jgi:DNA-binding FrmR family transcriptional regulator
MGILKPDPTMEDRMLDPEVKSKTLNRLSRVEGQVRGVARMVEDERYCIDILNQVAAIKAALAKVEGRLLQSHLEHCIEDAIIAGDKKEQRKKAAELVELLERAK